MTSNSCRCQRRARALLVVVLAWLVPSSMVDACQICLPVPTASAVDQLFESELVVLAQEDQAGVRVLEVIKGERSVEEIDLFLDEQTRQPLSLSAQRKIICAFMPEPTKGKWVRLGTADGVFDPLVREILKRTPEWVASPGQRLVFFADYLGHNNAQARNLAHLEFARAPYGEIKKFGGVLPAEELRTSLKNFRLFQWHALYILLLAQSGEQEGRDLIVEKVRSAERSANTVLLAAWTTAWIEIEEGAALQFLETSYLKIPTRTIEEMQAVVLALSVHGTSGHTHLRGRIVDGYRTALENYPQLALRIVTDLAAWREFGAAEEVARILDAPPTKLDRADLLRLRAYVREAEAQGSTEASTGGAKGVSGIMVAGVVILVLLAVGLNFMKRRGAS